MKKSSTTKLSVNLNKVATLRNTRHLGIPSLLRAAEQCLKAGAHGITLHPRPDERHVRKNDVYEVAELLKQYPNAEFNIEGNPMQNLMDFVRKVKPQQCTFVPDSENQFTSDHGWKFPEDIERLKPFVAQAQALGVRVSLFVDADETSIAISKETGADRVELYTEPWAANFGKTKQNLVLEKYACAAKAAQESGLLVNAGHDLNRENLTTFLRGVPNVAEVSIGHAFIADALEIGYFAAVSEYLSCIKKSITED